MPNPTTETRLTGPQDQMDYLQQMVYKDFQAYGYDPTLSEVNSLVPTRAQQVSGTVYDIVPEVSTAVANYVNIVDQYDQFENNNPLQAFQTESDQFFKDQLNQSNALYTQAQNVLKSSPQLFGNMSQDQITQYLAPLQTAFKTAQSATQTLLAKSGLSGSSVEANALSTALGNFQQSIVSQGLQIGLNQQTNLANLYQQQGQMTYGGAQQGLSQTGSAASGVSQQELNILGLKSSLPGYLGQQGLQDLLTEQQVIKSRQTSPTQSLNNLLSTITNIGSAVGSIASLGSLGGVSPTGTSSALLQTPSILSATGQVAGSFPSGLPAYNYELAGTNPASQFNVGPGTSGLL